MLARERGLTVEERPYSIEEWQADASSGFLAEAFACGTAATLVGIGKVRGVTREFDIANKQPGPLTISLRDELLALQRGAVADRHEWTMWLAES